MQYSTIKTEERNGIFIVTLSRPEAKNAMNNLMWQELCWAFDHLEETDELRCCIIANEGDCFCAGADLKEIAAGTHHAPKGYEKSGFAGMTKRYLKKPVIAATEGKVLGGGLEVVVACDLAVASSESTFSLPEPRRGLTAAGGGLLMRIMQMVPQKAAMELMLTCEPFSAQKALDCFLVNYVVEPGKVLDKAIELAELICKGAPLAIEYTKRTAYETMGENVVYPSRGWDILEEYEKVTQNSEDKIEGATAFAEKREPVWKGR
ncbi:MAG: enoyl-CoA hydratase-related protein [Coriobacteriia bacterium]|nr:enoyl-CoA hydratase-related protein [Coriobacteriia bacterium]